MKFCDEKQRHRDGDGEGRQPVVHLEVDGNFRPLALDATLYHAGIEEDANLRVILRPVVPIKVMVLTANPSGTSPIEWGREAATIRRIAVRESNPRPIEVEVYTAFESTDFELFVKQKKPTIIHFSGHGTEQKKFVLDDGSGYAHHFSYVAMGEIFRRLLQEGIRVRCILLNGCFTATARKEIGEFAEVIIGSAGRIADDAAIAFAQAFYSSLADGDSLGGAIERGKKKMAEISAPARAGRDVMSDPVDVSCDPEQIEANSGEGAKLEEIYL
jgi:hypothetical protein